ncbi:hypothetical protein [Caulobacter soli]|uniref:hypothetical protein n=1 Tax=Caulobacter soli TaxID=2708539 RepID=UPI0013EA765B|nr:hypothetical protein [Caulobacter soli]
MKTPTLDDHLLVQIALALAGAGLRGEAADDLEGRARRLGLSGAEIDAARDGRSFDVRAGAAVAVAIAARRADAAGLRASRAQALRLGLGSHDLDDIELWVAASSKEG